MTWFARKSRAFHKFNTIWPQHLVSGHPPTLATIKITVDGRWGEGNEFNPTKRQRDRSSFFFFFLIGMKKIGLRLILLRSTVPGRDLWNTNKTWFELCCSRTRFIIIQRGSAKSPVYFRFKRKYRVNNVKYYSRWITVRKIRINEIV